MTRRVTRPTLTLLMILALLPPLAGAGPLAQETPPATPGTAPPPEAPAGPAFVLSMQDAVKTALENNLDIVVRAYDPLRSEAQVIVAESIFDPLLNGTATSSSTQRPSPTAFVSSSKTHDFIASFIDPLQTGIELTDIPHMIDQRGDDIERELKKTHPDWPQTNIDGQVRAMIAQEFGGG